MDKPKFAEHALDDRYECEKIDEIIEILRINLQLSQHDTYVSFYIYEYEERGYDF
jgi:hypothetical protein